MATTCFKVISAADRNLNCSNHHCHWQRRRYYLMWLSINCTQLPCRDDPILFGSFVLAFRDWIGLIFSEVKADTFFRVLPLKNRVRDEPKYHVLTVRFEAGGQEGVSAFTIEGKIHDIMCMAFVCLFTNQFNKQTFIYSVRPCAYLIFFQAYPNPKLWSTYHHFQSTRLLVE